MAAATEAAPLAGGQGHIFSRESSGFVRVGTPWRMLALNFANIGFTYIMFTIWAHPAVFPQSNLLVALVVAAGFALFINMLYAQFATIMPRTGGEYVWLSRTFHPAIGFACSFAAAVSQSFWVGIGGYWIGSYVLGPMLTAFGASAGDATLSSWGATFSDPNVWFWLGTACVVLFSAINLRGLRFYLRFQDLNWIVGILTLVALAFVFLTSSHQDFVAGWDTYAAATGVPTVQGTFDLAAQAGMPTGFSITDTLGIAGIIFIMAFASTSIGAEVRTPKRSQLYGAVGGIIAYLGAVILLVLLLDKVVGLDFNQAVAWLSYNAPEGATVEAYPVFITFTGVLIHNTLLLLFVGAGMVLWSYFWLPSAQMIATRSMFAWSFDRLVPEKISEVGEKSRAPWVAVLITAVIAESFLFLYWQGVFSFLQPALAYNLVFFIASVAGIVFPYLKKTKPLYEASEVGYKVAGIPLMTICGVVGVIWFGLGTYYMLTVDALFLNSQAGLITTGLQFAIPLVIFFVAKWYRGRQGINLNATFAEIPPE
jgi:basic amino acid/polyamine antiporter, APA family